MTNSQQGKQEQRSNRQEEYTGGESQSTKAKADALSIQKMFAETPLRLTIHSTLEDFQEKFLAVYGYVSGTHEGMQQHQKLEGIQKNSSQDKKGGAKKKRLREEEKTLYNNLQACISSNKKFRQLNDEKMRVMRPSEGVYLRHFSNLLEFLRKRCGFSPTPEEEWQSQKFDFNFSDCGILTDFGWMLLVPQYFPMEAESAKHPKKMGTKMADTAVEAKPDQKATSAIRDCHHVGIFQLHMTHDGNTLLSYCQEYRELRNELEEKGQKMSDEKPQWTPYFNHSYHPIMTTMQVAGPFINISSSVLLPWSLALNIAGTFDDKTFQSDRLTKLAESITARLLPIALSLYFLWGKSNEDVEDIVSLCNDWDREIGEDDQQDNQGPKTREMLCEWVTGSKNPWGVSLDKDKRAGTEPHLTDYGATVPSSPATSSVDGKRAPKKRKDESTRRKVLSPNAIISSIVSFCVLIFGVEHRKYALPWLFEQIESAYKMAGIGESLSADERKGALEEAHIFLSKNITLHALVVFDHVLDAETASVPFPTVSKGSTGEKLTRDQREDQKKLFLAQNSAKLPRFYPFLEPPKNQSSFFLIQYDATTKPRTPGVTKEVVKRVRNQMVQVLEFLFRSTAAAAELMKWESKGFYVSSSPGPMLVSVEHLSKSSRSSVFRLHRSPTDQRKNVVIKCHTNHIAAAAERLVHLSTSNVSSRISPALLSDFETDLSIAMEDAGVPLSKYAFRERLVRNLTAEEYERTFYDVVDDAFSKLRQLQSIRRARGALIDIKPTNLLKMTWSRKNLQFIDFEEGMTTWKYAAPEITIDRYDWEKSPLWGMALSLLSLVLVLDEEKLTRIIPGGYSELLKAWEDSNLLSEDGKHLLIEKVGKWRHEFSPTFKKTIVDLFQPCLAIRVENRFFDHSKILMK